VHEVCKIALIVATVHNHWGFRTMPISVPGMPITGSGMMAIVIPG